jgi:glyceraldehyde 3-phosphate dehydrogenase
MTIRVAINGFGRIGRLFFRIASEHKNIEIVAINDLMDPDLLAYLLKYDTVHKQFSGKIEVAEKAIIVNGKRIQILAEKDPSKLPWKDLKIDFVIESTGLFTELEKAKAHITAGAKRVIVSAPGKGGMPMFVMGVNHNQYNPDKDLIVSNASCTTNCLAPITKVLVDNFGIDEALMTTVHAVTATQPTVDGPSKKDWRGGRAACYNIIPSSTGAAKAVGECIPQVKGKLTGMAFRVPVMDVSCVDLTARLSKDTTYEEICHAMKKASETTMKGFLAYTNEEVVSSDFIGSDYSSIFDEKAGIALNSRFFKVVAWYDNERGYAHRLVDLMEYMYTKEKK